MKNRLLSLMGEKQAKENRAINASTVARETGLTRQVVSKWIRGEVTEFREDIIMRFCKYFGVSLGDLLYIEDEEAEPQL